MASFHLAVYLLSTVKTMNAVTGMLKGLTRFASPSFYKAEYASIVKSVHTDMAAGSIRPLFQGMLLVGVVGYTMEYITIGRKYSSVLRDDCGQLLLFAVDSKIKEFFLTISPCSFSLHFI